MIFSPEYNGHQGYKVEKPCYSHLNTVVTKAVKFEKFGHMATIDIIHLVRVDLAATYPAGTQSRINIELNVRQHQDVESMPPQCRLLKRCHLVYTVFLHCRTFYRKQSGDITTNRKIIKMGWEGGKVCRNSALWIKRSFW